MFPFDYINRGMPIFPVKTDGKAPLTKNGYLDAKCDHQAIRKWQNQFGNSTRWGGVTGKASSITVIDIDKKNGGLETLQELRKNHWPLCPTVNTPGGGKHLWYKSPPAEIRSRTSVLQGFDVRSEGGYIVLPTTNSGYVFEDGFSLNDIEPPPLPNWLYNLLIEKQVTTPKPATHWQGFVSKTYGEGERNSTLTSLVGYLLAKRIDPVVALKLTLSFNKTNLIPSLTEDEVFNIVNLHDFVERSHPISWSGSTGASAT